MSCLEEIERRVPSDLIGVGVRPFRLCAAGSRQGAEASATNVRGTLAAWIAIRDPRQPAIKVFADSDAETQSATPPFVEAIGAATEHRTANASNRPR